MPSLFAVVLETELRIIAGDDVYSLPLYRLPGAMQKLEGRMPKHDCPVCGAKLESHKKGWYCPSCGTCIPKPKPVAK